ncbi:MAG: hypothetical protein FMNOHCHN_00404 [Ignavibacteriaceae bacterium]|nr:hypothetical protein [Ignavibacteriaceae bacterium]
MYNVQSFAALREVPRVGTRILRMLRNADFYESEHSALICEICGKVLRLCARNPELARRFYGCFATLIFTDRNILRLSAKSAGKFCDFARGTRSWHADFTDASNADLSGFE